MRKSLFVIGVSASLFGAAAFADTPDQGKPELDASASAQPTWLSRTLDAVSAVIAQSGREQTSVKPGKADEFAAIAAKLDAAEPAIESADPAPEDDAGR